MLLTYIFDLITALYTKSTGLLIITALYMVSTDILVLATAVYTIKHGYIILVTVL